MATPLPARWDGTGPVPPSMVAVLQSSGSRASVIDSSSSDGWILLQTKISPRTSSALAIDEWTRRLRDICGTFGLTAVIDNDMPLVSDVHRRQHGEIVRACDAQVSADEHNAKAESRTSRSGQEQKNETKPSFGLRALVRHQQGEGDRGGLGHGGVHDIAHASVHEGGTTRPG